jgi:hypothetical protein
MAPAVETPAVVREGTAGRYAWLLLLGLAVGWFEAAVVVDLRALYYPAGFRFPVVLVIDRVIVVEVVREAASILLLAAAARLAGRFFLERFAAFMILFGTWDLLYYVFLKLILGWPEGLADWDILFLIPVPWLGPVWAPCVVSLALVAAGSYLYWTADRPRVIRPVDWAVEVLAGLIVIASLVSEWRVVIEKRMPQDFPAGLFWTGVLLGLGWFVHRESAFLRSAEGALASGAPAPGQAERQVQQ